MPDQWRGDRLSAVGHPVVKTPTLDRLANGGALFRRAYSTCPSTPVHKRSRRLRAFPIKHPTFPALLAEAGYATVLVGRNMHQNAPNKSIGYQRELLGSTDLSDDDYDRALRAAAPESRDIRAVIESLGVTTNFWQAKPWALPRELHPTVWVAARARSVITETAPARPLFLTASFYAPHPPLFPPQAYFEKYLAATLPTPARGAWVKWDALSPDGDRNGHRI